MARQVLPIVGMVVGNIIAPGIGGMIGGMLGGLLGNAIDPMVVKGPKLGEAGLQTSAEGVYRPIVYGTGPVKGNIIERGNRQIRIHRQKQGKGGGPTTETERVSWTFAIRICEGPIGGILRIWEDEKLVYDVTPESTIPHESAAFAEKFTLYLGGEDQLPDPALEAFKGVGNVSAYRGSAYAVFPNYDLTDRGERIPDYRWEVASSITSFSSDALMTATVAGGPTAIPSPDAYDWSAQAYPPGTLQTTFEHLIAGPDRYVVHGNGFSAPPAYSKDLGRTWTTSVVATCTPRGFGCYVPETDTYYIPSDQGVLVSNNGAENFSIQPAGQVLRVIANAGNCIAYFTGGNLRTRIDGVWQNGVALGMNAGAGDGAATDGSIIRYGARTISDPEPIIFQTQDGLSSSQMTLPVFASSTTITAMEFGRFRDGTFMWIAGTDGGEMIADYGSGWELLPWTITGECQDIAFVGNGFVVIGTGSSTYDGRVMFTPDGQSVIPRPLYQASFLKTVASLPTPDQASSLPVALADIVRDIHYRSGQTLSYFDVSSLDDMVDGIVFAGDYSCADAIRSTMPIYTYDASEYDSGAGYRINYVKRGAPVQTTITIDDLTDAPEFLAREDALERPRVLHMHYESPSVGYAAAKASPRRFSPDVKVVGEISAQVPICFSDQDEAWQKADILLKQAWTEVAGEQDFAWPEHLIQLVPSDCVGVSLRGQVRRMRIQSVEYSGGQFQAKLIADRQSAYTSNITGIPLPPPTPPLPSIVGPTVFEFLDIPALNDNNDRLLYYTAASGQTDAWYGAAIQRKAPADTEWQDAGTYNRADYTVMGVALNAIPASSEDYTDTTNSLTIQLYRDDVIPQLTQQQLLSEGGSFALEKPDGTWELMQYRDAAQDSDGNWEISYFLRGRLNSGSSAHNAGASIVFLDYVKSVDAQTAWLDQDLTHRAVSFGMSPDLATEVVDQYNGLSQTEFPVAHLFLDRAGDTIRASCVPRHRFGTEDHPVRSINWTGYRWTATDGSNTESQDTTTEAANFDVTGWASPITVTVAQINRITGPGPIVSESIA